MTPKVVVFDLGKVLLDFDYSIAARQIAARSSLAVDQICAFIDQSPLLVRYETGLLTTEQFVAEVCEFTGFQGTSHDFAGFFADIFAPIPTMIELQTRLRSQGFPTYIFSNTNPSAVTHIQSRFPFFQNFDGYILSFEHGSMKPDAKLYEVAERATGCSGAEIVYLDDRAQNVAGGKKRGWQTILHETPEKSRTALKQIGLPI